METVSPPTSPAWTDVVLVSMGLLLAAGFVVGWASAIPLRVAGSFGSVLAATALVVGVVRNPHPLSTIDRSRDEDGD